MSAVATEADVEKMIVERVVGNRIEKGLIWHFQGSGKSLLMVFNRAYAYVERCY